MGEPIRVLHILQRMEAGGTQALLMNIYRKIDRTKVQFDFLVVYKEKQFYDDEIEKMGGHVYKLSFREDLNLPKFQKDLAVFFAQHHEYKIVHCHAYTIGYFCLKAAKKAGILVRIAHSHNNETVHDIKYLPKLFMQRMFTKNATDLFACSEEAGKYLFKDKPFQVLKNAIDSQNFIADADTRNEIRKELGLKDKFVVGHVGRLHPQKNHDFLIDVFAEIKKKKPNAELILVGTGPLEEKVKSKVVEKGLSDCVHFLGNRKDMNRIYQAMDVFVFPSLFEGLGIVAIEAQAAGVPIVCSEGLPPETDITPIYRKLLLSDGEEKWANAALEMAQNLKAHKPVGHYNFKKHLKAIVVFFAMSCATTIYTHLDTVMLGFIRTDVDVGYYNAAVKIKTILVSIVTSLGVVLLPRASYYVEHNMMDEFYRITKKAINFVFLIATPMMVYFMLFAKEGVFFLSGDAYAGAIIPMQVIMPTLLFIGLTNIMGIQMLVPLGKEKVVLYSEIAGMIVDIILNALLIPKMASTGAAIGTLAAEIAVFIVQYVALRGIIKEAYRQVHYVAIGSSVLAGGVLAVLIKRMQWGSFMTLCASTIVFFGVYFLILTIAKESLVIEIENQLLGRIIKKK